MSIEIEKEAAERMRESIRRYVDDEWELDIGDLKASLFLEFIAKEIGPSIYNQAVRDVKQQVLLQVDDVEDSLHQAEFSYWER